MGKNFEKYPGDRESIWTTFSFLGENHPSLTQSLTNTLLNIDPNLDSIEQNLNDPRYIGILMMVLKAASKLPVITSMVPSFIKKHYMYLKHSMGERVDTIYNFEPD